MESLKRKKHSSESYKNSHSETVQKRNNLSANRRYSAPLWCHRERTVRLYGKGGSGDLSSKNELFRSFGGFTLIEVLVASVILSSVFFAILTLISNNTHQITNLRNSKTLDELFLSSKACMQSFGYPALLATTGTQSLNFGTDNLGCFTGSYNPELSFTGILLEHTNDTETGVTTFWSFFTVQNNTGSLKIYNTLSDGTEKKDYSFIVGQ
ncbi:MAG: prepilin-type N-terminal cleavage/methylation domain-containing protein [Candidatus Gracilibacteria bacterium]|nr:prepilin-type N-terminal cleavage/methylation domain-containing protein [Candidatus Gracilibacteria bacterium]